MHNKRMLLLTTLLPIYLDMIKTKCASRQVCYELCYGWTRNPCIWSPIPYTYHWNNLKSEMISSMKKKSIDNQTSFCKTIIKAQHTYYVLCYWYSSQQFGIKWGDNFLCIWMIWVFDMNVGCLLILHVLIIYFMHMTFACLLRLLFNN